MFLLKARARRDTMAGFIAHLPESWGSVSPDKCSTAQRDFFIFFVLVHLPIIFLFLGLFFLYF